SGVGVPVHASGKDALRKLERGRLKLEDGDVAEFVARRIEELVVEDASRLARIGFAKDPLLFGVQIGLRGPTFDGVAQRLLPSVGLGQIILVEKKQAYRHHRSEEHTS